MAVIYKATNLINGKSYIGFDSDWPKRRSVHAFHARHIDDQSFYFHRALNKYGFENFEWSVICEDATLEDEVRLIEEHQTFWKNGGYNLTKGGDGNFGWVMPEEAKQKVSISMLGNKNCVGRVMSEETREKIRASLKARPKKPKPPKIKKERAPLTEDQLNTLRRNAQKMKETGHTEETKQKMSVSHKGKVFTEEHKANISKNHAAKRETGAYYQSEEYKQKMRDALTGKKRTPEQRERYRLAAIKRHADKKAKV